MHDKDLMDDVKYERQVMDDIYHFLYTKNHPLRYWYYGHFHESWHAQIDDVMFHMLDIMELIEIPPIDASWMTTGDSSIIKGSLGETPYFSWMMSLQRVVGPRRKEAENLLSQDFQ